MPGRRETGRLRPLRIAFRRLAAPQGKYAETP
jgi:hypothetical protein